MTEHPFALSIAALVKESTRPIMSRPAGAR